MTSTGCRAVALPIYNEEANLEGLLDFLLGETSFDRIVAVDDASTDRSAEILASWAARHSRIRALTAPERSGQLAAWRWAAEAEPHADLVCFVDADALPLPGAIGMLFDALDADRHLVSTSGRVLPDDVSARWPAARFRASVVHALRSLDHARSSIIGRFFAVRRAWFLKTATRSDIIANDSFLAGSAAREGLRTLYVPQAVCRYTEAQNSFDFAAQRQRADAGYAQLRRLNVLFPQDEPTFGDYARVFFTNGLQDPVGAFAWGIEQGRARWIRAYRAAGRDEGSWQVQESTKRRLGDDSARYDR
jgi:glycosyltransferase involved in cell wall biosynthesis